MEKIDPDYYKSSKMEVIDFIEAFDLGFNRGNAIWYIQREVDHGTQI